ncbi:MAG: DUF2162 domain-containing protein [Elusimicrobia bacterium]|nr:DUF2162 domain-containing protein [Elusimicrobiota bacterium]
MSGTLGIAGAIVALLVFGIKTGFGMAAIIYNKDFHIRKKLLLISGILLIHVILFACIYALLTHFYPSHYLNRLPVRLRSGMTMYLVIAAGLFIWGIALLFQRRQKTPFFVLPCPVWVATIFFAVFLAHSAFPFSLFFTAVVPFGIFIGISLVTIMALSPFRKRIEAVSPDFVGLVMGAGAIYFFLTAGIAPVYRESVEVYRIVSQSGNENPAVRSILIFIMAFIVLFGIGFLKRHRKINFSGKE